MSNESCLSVSVVLSTFRKARALVRLSLGNTLLRKSRVCRAPLYESTFVTFQGRPYMLWASGSQGWTVPGMRRVRYYLTSYKLALPDITRVPPATNIALRRRLATEWKMNVRARRF